MLNFHPIWSIEPRAAEMIERGLPELIDRIHAAGPRLDRVPVSRKEDDVVVINITGVMEKRESFWTFLGLSTSTETVRKSIAEAVDDRSVRSIVLNIDSPGGTVDGLHKLVSTVRDAAQRKPVIAQIDGMAASAAYWVASQATKIIAGHGDEIGSIGVRLILYDFSRMFANEGIEPVVVDTGEFKSAGAFGTEITQPHRAYFQHLVDLFFEDFVSDVAVGRKLSLTRTRELADGRMFIAKEAFDLGLVDGIGVLDDSIRRARRMGGRTALAEAKSRWRKITSRV